jgi:hypothetical protein
MSSKGFLLLKTNASLGLLLGTARLRHRTATINTSIKLGGNQQLFHQLTLFAPLCRSLPMQASF